jgi:class 3 adenylate cyclase
MRGRSPDHTTTSTSQCGQKTSTGLPRFKTVTVLCCDLAGSTALGERLDAERLRTLLARYFERMQSIVERHGGSVEKFIGDAVMAVLLLAGKPDEAADALEQAFERYERKGNRVSAQRAKKRLAELQGTASL